MPEERPFAARRILVGIDASRASLDALQAAASLAARLGSVLSGFFVEDEDLLRLAALPFGGIVRVPGGQRERLDPASAETALRAMGSRAREALERAASRHRISCSFEVRRGRVVAEVLAAAEGADLVVLGAAGHGRPARGAVGETARAAAARARASVLLLARGARLAGGVVAVDDGTPAGGRSIAAARHVAPSDRPPMIVCAGDADDAALAGAVARLRPALAVLPAAASARPGGVVDRLLAAGIAALLVR
jgi:nucleotide-binding universal stress UspA family protein